MSGRRAFARCFSSLSVKIPERMSRLSNTRSICVNTSVPAPKSTLCLAPKVLEAAHRCSPRSSHRRGGFVSPHRQYHINGSPLGCKQLSPLVELAAAACSPRKLPTAFANSPRRNIHTRATPRKLMDSPTRSFAREFSMGRALGSGAFGTVYEAIKSSDGSKKAVKVVPTRLMQNNEINMVRKVHTEAQRENRDASNVMNVDAVYNGSEETKVVTDLLAGGELLDYVFDKKCKFEELEAAKISKQVLESIKTCHKAGVAHLDVKPENFVFKKPRANTPDGGNGLVLIDFGSATEAGCVHKQEETSLKSAAGTMAYAAPELLDKKASLASDLWSAGIVSYILLTGTMPFKADPCPEDLHDVRNGNFNKTDMAWTRLSPEAKRFVEKLVHPNPKKRMTVEEALKHDFIIKKAASC